MSVGKEDNIPPLCEMTTNTLGNAFYVGNN